MFDINESRESSKMLIDTIDKLRAEIADLKAHVASRLETLYGEACPIILSPGDAMVAGAIQELREVAKLLGVDPDA